MSDNLNSLKKFSYKEQVSRSILWGHYFIFLNILLSCFIGAAYVYAAPETNSFLSFFYLMVSWLGHMSFLTVVTYLVIFFPLAFIGNFRYYRVLSALISVLLYTLLLFDLKIFLLVKVHLGLPAINLIIRELDFDTGLNYNFLFVAIPVVTIIEAVFAKLTTHSLYKAHHAIFVRSTLALVCSCFIISHILHIWADATQYDKITALRTVFPAHYPMTAKSFLSSHGWLSEDNLYQAQNDTYSPIKYPITNVKSQPLDKTHNIILISLNGLSYSNLSAQNTPNLLKFKSRAQSFDSHYLLYANEIDNVFSATYGLPLQYRKAILAEQMLPVSVEEMLRQDYIARFFVSLDHQEQNHSYYQNLTLSSGLRPNQMIEDQNDRQLLKKAYNLINKMHQEERNFAFAISLNDVKNYHDRSLIEYQDHIKRLLVLEALTPLVQELAQKHKDSPNDLERTMHDLLGQNKDQLIALVQQRKSEHIKQIKILAQQQIAYEQKLLQNSQSNATQEQANDSSKDKSNNQFDFKNIALDTSEQNTQNPQNQGFEVNQIALPTQVAMPQKNGLIFSSVMLKNHLEQYQSIERNYIYQVLKESKVLAQTLKDFDLQNYQQEINELNQDYIYLHETFNEVDPHLREIALYERSLKRSDALLGYLFKLLDQNNISDNTLIIFTSFEGNTLLNNVATLYDRTKQHVPLFIAWPNKNQIGTSVNALSSPQDINATIAEEILNVTTPASNYTLGNSLKDLIYRDFLIADNKEYITLIKKEDNTFYLQDGASFVEKDGKKLQIKPNLEDLIISTRKLNRFLK